MVARAMLRCGKVNKLSLVGSGLDSPKRMKTILRARFSTEIVRERKEDARVAGKSSGHCS